MTAATSLSWRASPLNRLLATGLGAAATAQLERGEPGALMGLVRGEVMATPLREVMSRKKAPDLALLELAGVLAR